ncbi:unnamed protein product [Bursaphelenchus xylophilus]|uniref:(pine wood nematode) hypothetical protein n=1 Tax=Bursaphelenchus xylophilus TaxID=6326 RepID=A0A1I7RI80_BURXY|nr:unnamed protein product [Bursaphelenchus xylophilus]CAG9115094.1 unnamed protein product [Bursaphelenchus xylophilus]
MPKHSSNPYLKGWETFFDTYIHNKVRSKEARVKVMARFSTLVMTQYIKHRGLLPPTMFVEQPIHNLILYKFDQCHLSVNEVRPYLTAAEKYIEDKTLKAFKFLCYDENDIIVEEFILAFTYDKGNTTCHFNLGSEEKVITFDNLDFKGFIKALTYNIQMVQKFCSNLDRIEVHKRRFRASFNTEPGDSSTVFNQTARALNYAQNIKLYDLGPSSFGNVGSAVLMKTSFLRSQGLFKTIEADCRRETTKILADNAVYESSDDATSPQREEPPPEAGGQPRSPSPDLAPQPFSRSQTLLPPSPSEFQESLRRTPERRQDSFHGLNESFSFQPDPEMTRTQAPGLSGIPESGPLPPSQGKTLIESVEEAVNEMGELQMNSQVLSQSVAPTPSNPPTATPTSTQPFRSKPASQAPLIMYRVFGTEAFYMENETYSSIDDSGSGNTSVDEETEGNGDPEDSGVEGGDVSQEEQVGQGDGSFESDQGSENLEVSGEQMDVDVVEETRIPETTEDTTRLSNLRPIFESTPIARRSTRSSGKRKTYIEDEEEEESPKKKKGGRRARK